MRRSEYPTFLDWYHENQREYLALAAAEDGNPELLVGLITEAGDLKTLEARGFVADRLMGVKRKVGLKRTITQQAKEWAIWAEIRKIQVLHGCGEHSAMKLYLAENHEMNAESLKTYLRRAKSTFTQFFGREPTPPVHKSDLSEPE